MNLSKILNDPNARPDSPGSETRSESEESPAEKITVQSKTLPETTNHPALTVSQEIPENQIEYRPFSFSAGAHASGNPTIQNVPSGLPIKGHRVGYRAEPSGPGGHPSNVIGTINVNNYFLSTNPQQFGPPPYAFPGPPVNQLAEGGNRISPSIPASFAGAHQQIAELLNRATAESAAECQRQAVSVLNKFMNTTEGKTAPSNVQTLKAIINSYSEQWGLRLLNPASEQEHVDTRDPWAAYSNTPEGKRMTERNRQLAAILARQRSTTAKLSSTGAGNPSLPSAAEGPAAGNAGVSTYSIEKRPVPSISITTQQAPRNQHDGSAHDNLQILKALAPEVPESHLTALVQEFPHLVGFVQGHLSRGKRNTEQASLAKQLFHEYYDAWLTRNPRANVTHGVKRASSQQDPRSTSQPEKRPRTTEVHTQLLQGAGPLPKPTIGVPVDMPIQILQGTQPVAITDDPMALLESIKNAPADGLDQAIIRQQAALAKYIHACIAEGKPKDALTMVRRSIDWLEDNNLKVRQTKRLADALAALKDAFLVPANRIQNTQPAELPSNRKDDLAQNK
jgi:hypothetical protein